MKYGTPLHVSISNQEFKIASKIIKLMKNVKDFNPPTDFNKVDEEGNNALHSVMKQFNHDKKLGKKIAM
jgi:hypothetical protein